MWPRVLIGALLLTAAGSLPVDDNPTRDALQALNEFIGEWKGSGAPDKPRPDSKTAWRETVAWSWKFKGEESWLVMQVKDGKYFASGELRYLPGKKLYQLTAIDKQKKTQIFEGEFKNGYLNLDRVDPESKETQRLTMNSAADGIRFIYRLSRKPADRTLFTKDYQVAFTKEGESFASKEKKVECVVSGGLGTSQVAHNGVTYYVCCSGCRDAFNENPEKYIKEFEAKKKK